MAGNHSSAAAMENSVSAIKSQWEIEYSRFFNYPSLSSVSPMLKPLPEYRFRRSRGSWMSSSSIASLDLTCKSSDSETILTVNLRGNLLEEHFICNLHFSWPQVSCVTQCPIRGSRVVFASYRDCSDQIQKFALRFATSCDAESFINFVKVQPRPFRIMGKESVTNGLAIGSEVPLPNTDLESEVSSHSEFDSSHRVQHRAKEELNLVNHVGTYSPQIQPALNCDYKCSGSEKPLFPHGIEDLCLGLPPSFTALLTQCASEFEEEKPKVVPGEIDLKSQITRYMSDSSFHEMLTKVEEVINELGGDLTL